MLLVQRQLRKWRQDFPKSSTFTIVRMLRTSSLKNLLSHFSGGRKMKNHGRRFSTLTAAVHWGLPRGEFFLHHLRPVLLRILGASFIFAVPREFNHVLFLIKRTPSHCHPKLSLHQDGRITFAIIFPVSEFLSLSIEDFFFLAGGIPFSSSHHSRGAINCTVDDDLRLFRSRRILRKNSQSIKTN